jgi:hypothetical protein
MQSSYSLLQHLVNRLPATLCQPAHNQTLKLAASEHCAVLENDERSELHAMIGQALPLLVTRTFKVQAAGTNATP